MAGAYPAKATAEPFSHLRALEETLHAERPRWFLWVPVFLGAGIASYFGLEHEPSGALAMAVLGAASVLRALWRGSLASSLLGGAILAMSLGFALAKARTEWTRAPIIERTLQRAVVQGVVELVEARPDRGERITLKVSSIEGIEAARLPRRARVRTMVTTAGLKPGDEIRLRAKIGPPAPPSAPGDYDFARAAWFQELGATGYALSKAEILQRAPPPSSMSARFSLWLETVRQAIGARIAAVLPGERGAIATALITGARGAITNETNAAFRDSGLFHVLSISGLHMVVMAGAAFLGLRRVLALVPAIALNYPIKKWAAFAALIAAMAYLALSGSSVATVRSAVMIAIIFLAVLIDRPALAMRNVALSALLILIVMPESLLDAGFQMSFAAVIALIAVYEVLRQRSEARERGHVSQLAKTGTFFGGIVLTTLIASLSVAPLAIYHFHRTQQFAILANVIAVPVCNIVVMPAALVTLLVMPFGLEALPLKIMGLGVDGMMAAAQAVAAIPGATGHVPAIPGISLVVMCFGGLWLTLWQTRWRLLGAVLALVGLGLAFRGPEGGDIFAARDGTLVALRDATGSLAATPGRHSGYDLQRWLENDGDARDVSVVSGARADGRPIWRCDQSGCLAEVKGVRVAAVRQPQALEEDCAKAEVVITPFEVSHDGRLLCGARLVLDKRVLARGGTHRILIGDSSIGSPRPLHIETVADRRGARPWCTVEQRAYPEGKPIAAKKENKLEFENEVGRLDDLP